MDSQQAKDILMRYRPGGDDAADPEVAEALEQIKCDPKLAHWFEQHCVFQSAVRDQFEQITVPADLKERILDGCADRKIIWWRRPVFRTLAAAAAIALLVSLVWFRLPPREDGSFSAYRNGIVRRAQRMYQMDMVTNNLGEIRHYLAKNEAHADYQAPAALEKLPGDGCAILRWHNKKVALVCYDSGRHNDLFLFIIDRGELPNPPAADQPQFARIGKLATASWSHGDKTYILAGPGDEQFLGQYLSPY